MHSQEPTPAATGGKAKQSSHRSYYTEIQPRLPFPSLPLPLPQKPQLGTLAYDAARMLMSRPAGITHPDFQEVTQSWRLSAVVYDLRRMGWPVYADSVSRDYRRCIARYRLREDDRRELVGVFQ